MQFCADELKLINVANACDEKIYGWCEISMFSRRDARLESNWRRADNKFHRDLVDLKCFDALHGIFANCIHSSRKEDKLRLLRLTSACHTIISMNFTLGENHAKLFETKVNEIFGH